MKGRILLFALLLLAASCKKEKAPDQPDVPSGTVTIEATLSDTKVALPIDESGVIHRRWESDDCLRVSGGSGAGKFTIMEGFTATEASFTGPKITGKSFDIMYPGTFESVAEAEATDFGFQVQDGNGSTAHLFEYSLLSGVDDYRDITFSDAWAESHGGSLKCTGVLAIENLRLPESVSVVDRVDVSYGGRKLSLQLENVDMSSDEELLDVFLTTPWDDIVLPPGGEMQIVVTASDGLAYGVTASFFQGHTLRSGVVNHFEVTDVLQELPFTSGSGSEEDPWLIGSAHQLENMMNLYKDAPAPADKNSFKYWFKLIDDIDASSITWVPLNNSGSFYKAIDFDGGGHTITGLTCTSGNYPSFAGVLYGSVHNVTFDRATISGASKKGVVAGFVGTTGLPASCKDVTVSNSTVSGSSYSGGFAGHCRTTGSIESCRVVNTAVSSDDNPVGGFTAFADITDSDKYEVPVRFIDCHVENSTVTQLRSTAADNVFTGGFIACANTGAGFNGCSFQGEVNATAGELQDVGGFIGRASYACPTFMECSVLTGSKVETKGHHAGGFVGYSMVAASYTGCSSAADVISTTEYVGGFAGYSAGASSYTGCSASGGIKGVKHTAGFVGLAENSGFTDCFFTGSVEDGGGARSQSGGFCGLATTGVSFRGCYLKGASFVSISGTYVGGFIGQLGNSYTGGNDVYASQCHLENTAVTGSTNCGGFVGVQYGDISLSYVSGGSVTAKGAHCGGFSGFIQNSGISFCYSTASVEGGGYSEIGGFAGIIHTASISYCYSAGSVSGSGSSVGAFAGKCDRQGSNPLAWISYCIGWDASLPFCATNDVGASITDCYAGTDGSVTSVALSQSWPSAVWDLSVSLPTLLDTPRRINAIFIGDSITWQWAITSRTIEKNKLLIPYSPLPSYMTDSGDNVIVSFHPGFFTANGYLDKGVSGQNTTQMLARFKKDVVDLDPVVAVIMAGTNDLAQGVTKEQIVANIQSMAEMAEAAGIKVVLCTVTPCNDSYSRLENPKTKGAHIIALNGMLKEYADSKGFRWCDYWSVTVADDGLALHPDYCLYDRLHPGPAGYTVMEGVIKPIIDSLL